MKAITIIPTIKGSTSLRDVPKAKYSDEQVLVKVLETGVCRTDLEIYEGLYGKTPINQDYLIMGHESLGIVEAVGNKVHSIKKGDYVVRTVRRPCKDACINCRFDQNDMCLTGNYVEAGIVGLDGVMTEFYAEKPKFLININYRHKNVGVLMEPLSFSEKAVRKAYEARTGFYWEPKKALVVGAGPIGLLEAMILRNKGLKTIVAARSEEGNLKSDIVTKIGANYVSTKKIKLKDLGKFDIIIESSGVGKMVKQSMEALNTNGVLCLTSITGSSKNYVLPLDQINLDFVLGNKAIVGAVNANIKDFEQGTMHLNDFERKWPGVMRQLITRREKPEDYKEAFEKRKEDIKTIIEF